MKLDEPQVEGKIIVIKCAHIYYKEQNSSVMAEKAKKGIL